MRLRYFPLFHPQERPKKEQMKITTQIAKGLCIISSFVVLKIMILSALSLRLPEGILVLDAYVIVLSVLYNAWYILFKVKGHEKDSDI